MSTSKIEWLARPGYKPAVWNVVDGCTHKSPGCDHCWARRFAGRQMGPWRGRKFSEVRCHDDRLQEPLHWRAPRMIFAPSMGDPFHEKVTDEFILKMLSVMALTPRHRYLLLTKRPERMPRLLGEVRDWAVLLSQYAYEVTGSDEAYCWVANAVSGVSKPKEGPMGWPLPNLWLGVSVENREQLGRLEHLRNTPAAVRFVSFEPLLENLGTVDLSGINWAIIGGESGPGARVYDVKWGFDLLDQCERGQVFAFHKQCGANVRDSRGYMFSDSARWPRRIQLKGVSKGVMLKDPKGADPAEWPKALQVRQWPK